MKRRRYIINWKFQLKYCMFSILPVLILGLILSVVIFNISRSIINSQKEQLMTQIASLERTLNLLDKLELEKKITETFKNEIKNLKVLSQELIAQNMFEFTILNRIVIVGVFILVVGITFLGIIFSHRIAGPIFRVKRLILELIQDIKLPIQIKVRKYDEFQDFFSALEKLRIYLMENKIKREKITEELVQKISEIKKGLAPEISMRLEELKELLRDLKEL